MENGIRHPTLGEKAYDQIKDLILSGKILPGERLLYVRLVKELGVSQTPIKEAFTRLEDEGYVVTVQRKGTFARSFTRREITEAFEIREMLEALAARRACANVNAASLARLKKINARFAAAARRRDVRGCTHEDYAFHDALIEISGNEKLKELLKKSSYLLQSIARNSPLFLKISGNYTAMHARLIQAIEDRDADAAEKVVREHIRYGRDEVVPSLPA